MTLPAGLELELIPVKQLDRGLVRALKRLSFGANGLMSDELDELRQPWNPRRANALILRDQSRAGLIIGWALIQQRAWPESGWAAYFYVRASERRKGYGRLLMRAALRRHRGPVAVDEHDQRAHSFFSSCRAISRKPRLVPGVCF